MLQESFALRRRGASRRVQPLLLQTAIIRRLKGLLKSLGTPHAPGIPLSASARYFLTYRLSKGS